MSELERFCVEVQPALYRALTVYCGDAAVAEDLTQEALVRVVQHWRRVQKMDHPEAWAHRVAINLANSRFRRAKAERRARTRMTDNPVADEADPSVSMLVRDALAALPKRQRAVLVLRFLADLSVEETASQLHCSPGTVKAHTHRAIGALRSNDLVAELHEAQAVANEK